MSVSVVDPTTLARRTSAPSVVAQCDCRFEFREIGRRWFKVWLRVGVVGRFELGGWGWLAITRRGAATFPTGLGSRWIPRQSLDPRITNRTGRCPRARERLLQPTRGGWAGRLDRRQRPEFGPHGGVVPMPPRHTCQETKTHRKSASARTRVGSGTLIERFSFDSNSRRTGDELPEHSVLLESTKYPARGERNLQQAIQVHALRALHSLQPERFNAVEPEKSAQTEMVHCTLLRRLKREHSEHREPDVARAGPCRAAAYARTTRASLRRPGKLAIRPILRPRPLPPHPRCCRLQLGFGDAQLAGKELVGRGGCLLDRSIATHVGELR